MEENIIMLEDENGQQIEFAAIDVFELNDETYFALLEVMPTGRISFYHHPSGDVPERVCSTIAVHFQAVPACSTESSINQA